MAARIGQILVGRCLLTQTQVDQLLELQATDPRALGEIAADYFGLPAEQVCEALAEQIEHDCTHVDLAEETIDPHCLQIISAQEAEAALTIPMRVEQAILICVTTKQNLQHAIKLFQTRTSIPVRFVLATNQQVTQHLTRLYSLQTPRCCCSKECTEGCRESASLLR